GCPSLSWRRFCMKPSRQSSLAAVLVLSLVATLPCAAQPPVPEPRPFPVKQVIVDVAIQGNQKLTTEELHHLIHLQPGSEYHEEALQEDVARLHQTTHFKDIQIVKQDAGDDGIKVTFLVTEFPQVIEEVVYQGAKHISAGDLERITGLRKGS